MKKKKKVVKNNFFLDRPEKVIVITVGTETKKLLEEAFIEAFENDNKTKPK